MILHATLRDCLYVNWALPPSALPALPDELTYEVHGEGAGTAVFASLVCFRHQGIFHEAVPFVRVGYPQLNLRLYVRDRDGVASVFFVRMLVPAWVVAGARIVGHQPASPAALDFPAAGLGPGPWGWSAWAGARVALAGSPGAGVPGPGPDLGSWQSLVAYFRERPRGYATQGGKLRLVEATHPVIEHAPVRIEVEEHGLLAETLPGVDRQIWSRPHSAFVCPLVPFVFEVGGARQQVVAAHVPAAT